MSANVDARGLSCPQPVMMALKAQETNPDAFVVEVDHETAAENVERAMKEKGRQTKIVKSADGYTVEVASK